MTKTALPSQRSVAAFVTPLGLLAIGVALYLPGIQWGLPATVSWSQDTIAGLRTIGPMEQWPEVWTGRYPPAQYMILRAAYQPVLSGWDASGERYIDPDTGRHVLKPPQDEKIGKLFFIARLISMAMALATVLGVWASARELIRDELGTALATIAFMSGAGFAYFARLGNVDVPSMCWFTWSLYFYARALRSRTMLNAAMLGLLGSLAISTKDSVAGMYPGMALVLLWLEIKHFRSDRSAGNPFVKALLQPRWLVGIIAFVVPYLVINGAFANWDGYVTRMTYWLNPPASSLHAQQHHYANQFELLWASVRYAASATGWPMVAALVASVFYIVKRHRALALVVLPPVIGYYLIVIVPTGFVYERFLFPILAMLFIPAGLVASAFLRMRRVHTAWRLTIVAAALLPSLAYTTALNVEVTRDTRYDAEDWILEKQSTTVSIGALVNDLDRPFRPQYLPRLHHMGYSTFPIIARTEVFDTQQPDILLLSQYDYDDFKEDQRACVDHLLAGRLGYEPVIQFKARYLGTGKSWLGVAGWLAPTPGKISPTITIFKRIQRNPLD
jgi:Dolichyl-phosphate-mannose-protein mannosyltransferase